MPMLCAASILNLTKNESTSIIYRTTCAALEIDTLPHFCRAEYLCHVTYIIDDSCTFNVPFSSLKIFNELALIMDKMIKHNGWVAGLFAASAASLCPSLL